jgi:hypothetical protein
VSFGPVIHFAEYAPPPPPPPPAEFVAALMTPPPPAPAPMHSTKIARVPLGTVYVVVPCAIEVREVSV